MPTPTTAVDKSREEELRRRLEIIVNAFQPLTNSERVRLLRTVVVFFGLEGTVE